MGVLQDLGGEGGEPVGEDEGAVVVVVGGGPDGGVDGVDVVDDFHGVAPGDEAGCSLEEEDEGGVEGEVGEGPEVVV